MGEAEEDVAEDVEVTLSGFKSKSSRASVCCDDAAPDSTPLSTPLPAATWHSEAGETLEADRRFLDSGR